MTSEDFREHIIMILRNIRYTTYAGVTIDWLVNFYIEYLKRAIQVFTFFYERAFNTFVTFSHFFNAQF